MRFVFVSFALLFLTEVYSQSRKIKIACVGNSITWGSGVENRVSNCYPQKLEELLGEGYEVMNFGVSGSTLLKLGDNPYMKTQAYREALEYQPDIVIIKLGTNDSKPHNWEKYGSFYKEDYLSLIQSFRQLPSRPRIYLCLPVPAYKENFTIRPEVVEKQVLPLVREVAREAQTDLIDLFTPLSQKPELFPDYIHPNAAGAALIAQTVAEELKKTLPKRK